MKTVNRADPNPNPYPDQRPMSPLPPPYLFSSVWKVLREQARERERLSRARARVG